MKKDNQTPLQQLDYTLLFIIFLMLCVSLIAIYNAPSPGAASNLVIKQFIWYIVGGIIIAVVMLVDFDRYRQFSWLLYGLGIILLVGLFVVPDSLAPEKGGAVSWYAMPGIGSFQPSEVMKIFLIITLGHVIVKHHDRHQDKTLHDDLWLLGKIIGLSIIPILLVVVEPDIGSALVLAAISGSLLLISGIRWRVLLLTTLSTILFVGLIVFIYISLPEIPVIGSLFDHVELRILGWLFPHDYPGSNGLQLIRSKEAIGAGQLYGKGLDAGLSGIPVAYSDFIFPVIAKQFGFLGASVVISLFFLLIYRIIHTALATHDRFGSYLCTGVIGMLTFQVFQNVGMSIQILPISGISLPFISYGGTGLLTFMIAIGLVLNVRSRQRSYMFD